jgi:hypothetical protein
MHLTRWMGGLTATAVTAGALLAGGGTAVADTGTPAPAPAGNDTVCTQRIPALLARIDKVTARINGSASTRGSTAWLQARQDAARSAGNTARADLIAARITDRPQRRAALGNARSQVEHVQSTDCAS